MWRGEIQEGGCMGLSGPDFYDDAAVLARYQQQRARSDAPNETIEAPVIWSMLGDVTGRSVLDLGCGAADFGRELLARGAAHYLGIEGSQRMAALAAQTLAGTGGRVVRQTLEEWDYPTEDFDVVTSRLALHYVDDLATLVRRIAHTLRPGGQLVFSVEHPVITSCDRGWAGGLRQDWIVDGYFEPGLRVTTWMGGTVQKYHRTVAQYVACLHDAGFTLECLSEGEPQAEYLPDPATLARRKRIPLFLILACRKGPAALQRRDPG
jgi:SAM-dependent methyltransferase